MLKKYKVTEGQVRGLTVQRQPLQFVTLLVFQIFSIFLFLTVLILQLCEFTCWWQVFPNTTGRAKKKLHNCLQVSLFCGFSQKVKVLPKTCAYFLNPNCTKQLLRISGKCKRQCGQINCSH